MPKVEDVLAVRLEASLRKFEKQMDAARKAGVFTATDVERRFDRMGGKVQRSAAGAAGGLTRVLNVSRGGRFVLQNTANQIGDIAVQLESGTSGFRVMGQQLPQILGGFGALSGVLGIVGPLLGTIAAVGLPVAAVLWNMSNAAEDAGDKQKTFADRVSEAEAAIRSADTAIGIAAEGNIEHLKEVYGEASEEVLSLIRALAANELEIALRKTNEALNEFFTTNVQDAEAVSAFDDWRQGVADMQREIEALQDQVDAGIGGQENVRLLKQMRAELEAFDRMDGFADEFGIDPAQIATIRELRSEIEAALTAGDSATLVDKVAELRQIFETIPDGPLSDISGRLAEIEDLIRQADAQAQRVSETAEGISFDGGAASAGQMADELARAANNALRVLSLQNQASAQVISGRGNGMLEVRARRGQDSSGAFVYDGPRLDANNDPIVSSRGGRGGGGGGGRGGADREQAARLREAERLFNATRTAAEKYEMKLAELNDLKSRNLITDDTFNRALEDMKEDLEGIGGVAKKASSAIRSAFDGLFDDPSAALEDLAKQLAQMAIFQQLGNSFPSIFGAGGIIPLAGARAAGGPVSSGRPYLVGERGPEIVVPNMSGMVVPNHQIGGGGTQVNVINNGPGEARTERRRGPDGTEIVQVIVEEGIARGRFDGANRSRFGSRAQVAKRG